MAFRGTRVPPAYALTQALTQRPGRVPPGTSQIVDVRERYNSPDTSPDALLLSIMGRGIAYPFEFTAELGTTNIKEQWGRMKIQDSIFLILSTRPGERFFNPLFGSRLPLLVFEPYDDILKQDLIQETADAVDRWEPRITVVQVIITDDDDWLENSRIGITIEYVLRNTNVKGNYVYPYVLGGEPPV